MRFRRSAPPTTAPATGPTTAPGGGVTDGLSVPSIWVGSFRDQAEWEADAAGRDAMLGVFDAIDDRMMRSRHPFDIKAWCAVCAGVRPMALAWHLGEVNAQGSVNPAWTLNGCCHECGLVSRMRALIDFLQTFPTHVDRVYTAERLTECFPVLDRMYPGIVGSEFLGDDREPGTEYPHETGVDVRHEDMTKLSFADGQFDLVITQDVFEHVPDYRAAFVECHRVTSATGRLVFTIPFFADQSTTEVRATVGPDGAVTHLLPPEIHGNPVGDGSLCFQHFGWDILDDLRSSGFADARAHMYWGPWAGHMGYPSFIFEASRGT